MLALFTINRLFKKKKKDEPLIKGACFDGKSLEKTYDSYAEKFEARNDYNLQRKFPFLAKVGIRVRMIISEIGIMAILILQTLILLF